MPKMAIFRRPIILQPTNVDTIVKPSVLLHNFLTGTEGVDNNGNMIPPQRAFRNVSRMGGNRGSNDAMVVRDTFKEYFSSVE